MTFAQIVAGVSISLLVAVAAVVYNLSVFVEVGAALGAIMAMAIGGMDGTLPRQI